MTFALNYPPQQCLIVDNRPLFFVIMVFLWVFVFSYASYIFAYRRNLWGLRIRADTIEKLVFRTTLPSYWLRTISEAVETPPAKANLLLMDFVLTIYAPICFASPKVYCTIIVMGVAFCCVAFTGYRKMHHQLAALPFIVLQLVV